MTEGKVKVGRGLGAFPEEMRGKMADLLAEAHKQPLDVQAETIADGGEDQDHGVDIEFRPLVQVYKIDGRHL